MNWNILHREGEKTLKTFDPYLERICFLNRSIRTVVNQPVKHVKANAKSKARLTVFDIAEPCPTGGNAVLGAKEKK